MIIPIIIGGSLAAAGIITLIIGCKKIKINNLVKEENKDLEKTNQFLKEEESVLRYKMKWLVEQVNVQRTEQDHAAQQYCDNLDLVYQAKELEFDTKLKMLTEQFQRDLEKSKEESWISFNKYVEGLDNYYLQVEKDFDISLEKILKTIEEHKEDLEKIKQTYAAAREAQIREEEIALKAEFYSLHLTESEQIAVTILEELKPRFPVPRALSKVIWETFFQKQASSLCSYVLGPGTVCGIYKITNKKNGLCYIGQSVDVANRWKEHIKCGLGIDTPIQNKLYKAMLNDGITNFTFELLEKCERNLLNEKEKFYIELYQSCNYGYNSTVGNK